MSLYIDQSLENIHRDWMLMYTMGFWLIVVYQCKFIDRNKCATPVLAFESGGGYSYVSVEMYGKFLKISLNFVVTSKLL